MNPRSLCAIALTLALPALGQTEPQLEPLVPPSLPPIAPLTPSRPLKTLGVLVLGALADETAVRVGDGIRAAAKLAPGVKEALVLDAPHPCADKACWVTAGVAQSVDQVVVATYTARTLKVRLVDVKARKVVREANRRPLRSSPSLPSSHRSRRHQPRRRQPSKRCHRRHRPRAGGPARRAMPPSEPPWSRPEWAPTSARRAGPT